MASRLTGRVQSGKGDASHWLRTFNAACSRKVGAAVFPGSLNIALAAPFDWFAPGIVRRTIPFDRAEYGGELEIIAATNLRAGFGLVDGSIVEVQLRDEADE